MSVQQVGTDIRALRELEDFPLVEALFGRRSRRFARGGEIPDGPLAYRSGHEPVPLSELERMLILGAMGGTTGWHFSITRHARYAPHVSNYSAAVAGRTFPSAAGFHTAELFFTDDSGVYVFATRDAFGSTPPAGAQQGFGDWFGKAIGGAKDVLRVFSYNTMKARAGTVGRNGLGPLLAALHAQSPAVRVHLIGHSFGARLVSFALSGVGEPASSPVASLVLLQGAFSHWSFAHAQDNPFGSPGALNAYADRVHGPLAATHTVYDWAVGVWYPKASFLAHQDAAAAVADRWGGMGSDGFQAVKPAEDRAMPAQGGTSYDLAPGTFYRIDAASVINDTKNEPFSGAHSDIKKLPVAQLAAAAAAAHA